LNISLITDWDVGIEGEMHKQPVTVDEVIRVFNENNERVKDLIHRLVPMIPQERGCTCGSALQGAVIG